MGNTQTSQVAVNSDGNYFSMENNRQHITISGDSIYELPHRLMITAFDDQGQRVKNAVVTFRNSSSELIFDSSTQRTNSKGKVKLPIKVNSAGVGSGKVAHQIFFTINIKNTLFLNNYFELFVTKT